MDPIGLNFIDLNLANVVFLLSVGFIGGLVSGFIGSGGAFVLTPAMMSMGVPGVVAVASNICHKFPKALAGAITRAKYGQVDAKLGLVVGMSAELGVVVGARVQEQIAKSFGGAGSNLYVSSAFVLVLGIVGTYVLIDAYKSRRLGEAHYEEKPGRLALWVQSVNIPGTMVYFSGAKARISFLFTLPLGFATGFLAATIAVGGFIGVPGMIYILGVPGLTASATELVIAFIMGLGGTVKYAWSGLVDIRLALVILAGSLFGVQLGAIATTYAKPYLIKLVMGVIMIFVLFSRALMLPLYISELNLIAPLREAASNVLKNGSLILMVLGLVVGAFIILRAVWHGHRSGLAERAELGEVGVSD
jgi:uncharacterized membrane protein YfcA